MRGIVCAVRGGPDSQVAIMVTAGISERAGHPISYVYFLRKGFPALAITVGLSTVWLLLRFLVLGG